MLSKETVVDVMNHLIGYIDPTYDVDANKVRISNLEKVVAISEECINDLIRISRYRNSRIHDVKTMGYKAYDTLTQIYELIGNRFNEDIYPCDKCDAGWGSISSEGCKSCSDDCQRLKEYYENHKKGSI